jgi:hypothetical protein
MLLGLKDRSAVLADDIRIGKTILILALLGLLNRKIGLKLEAVGYSKFDFPNSLAT